MVKDTSVTKLSQVLSIEPSTQITFRGDFRDVVSVDLSLRNSTNRRVCFKVKTNYPHRYFVRPNGGLIEPSQQQTVTIMLQPLEVIEAELKLHKFMVQAIFAPDGPINGLERLWKETRQENVMDTKIPCVFDQVLSTKQEVPRYRGTTETEINGTTMAEGKPEIGAKSGKKEDTESTSFAALLIVLLILLCIILLAYLKLK